VLAFGKSLCSSHGSRAARLPRNGRLMRQAAKRESRNRPAPSIRLFFPSSRVRRGRPPQESPNDEGARPIAQRTFQRARLPHHLHERRAGPRPKAPSKVYNVYAVSAGRARSAILAQIGRTSENHSPRFHRARQAPISRNSFHCAGATNLIKLPPKESRLGMAPAARKNRVLAPRPSRPHASGPLAGQTIARITPFLLSAPPQLRRAPLPTSPSSFANRTAFDRSGPSEYGRVRLRPKSARWSRRQALARALVQVRQHAKRFGIFSTRRENT